MDSVTVSRKLTQGMTPDQIREQAVGWAGKAYVKGRNGRQAKPENLAKARSYVPSRGVAPRLASSSGSAPTDAPVTPSKPVAGKVNGNGRGSGSGHSPAEPVQPETYAQAELRKMKAFADERELKVEQMRGSLVPPSQVNLWFGQQIVKARDVLFRIPAEFRDRLSVEDDPLKCEKMLMDELVRAVAELREMPMPGGVAPPVMIGQADEMEEDE